MSGTRTTIDCIQVKLGVLVQGDDDMPIPEKMFERLKNAPPLKKTGLQGARQNLSIAARKTPKVSYDGEITERIISTSVRQTPVRVYQPQGEASLPVVVYFHGGGFVMGDLELMDHVCRIIANAVGCAVVNVEYGLAPEYKFPGGLEECYEVVKWVHDNAALLRFDPDNIVVAGDSAGGNFATAVCLLAKQRMEFSLVHQVLFYPVVDFTMDNAAKFEGLPEVMLNAEDLSIMGKLYFASESDKSRPEASPLLAPSLAGLPPATVITAGIDPLGKEALLYVERLKAENIPVEHKHFPEMVHAFLGFAGIIPEADLAIEIAVKELKKTFEML